MSNPWDELNNDGVDNKSGKENDDKGGEGIDYFYSFFNYKKNMNDQSKISDKIIGNIKSFFYGDLFDSKKPNSFKGFIFVFGFIIFFWLISGFYIIKQEETAIIMRFGKYVRTEISGLHYHLPFPIEEVVKEATTRVRVIKIGGNKNNGELSEGWALTGDENIVNLELNVQWKIDDLKKFVFSVRDKEQTIYDAAQSAIREVISNRKLASILTSGRGEIEEETKKILQGIVDSYNIGVNIVLVQMLKIDPPAHVIDSFRDVQTARVDKESEINKAYKYKNDILPKIKGEAGKIIEDANGYAISVVNKAKGDASRFNQIYEQYKNAPYITRKRMYLETMENIFSNNSAIIVDENVKNLFLDGKKKDIKKELAQSQSNVKIEEDN